MFEFIFVAAAFASIVGVYFIGIQNGKRKSFKISKNNIPVLRQIKNDYNLIQSLKNARKNISILVFHESKLFSLDEALEILSEKIRLNIEIKILIINPFSFVAFIRSSSKAYDNTGNENFFLDIFSELAKLKELNKVVSNSKFDVRIYSHLPSVSIHRFDDEIVVGLRLEHLKGMLSPFFTITKMQSDLFEKYIEHFNEVWNNSISIFDNSFIKLAKKERSELNLAFESAINKLSIGLE